MKTTLRPAIRVLVLFALLTAVSFGRTALAASDALRATGEVNPSLRLSFPIGVTSAIAAVRGGEREVRLLAQVNAGKAAEAPAERTEEEKKRARSAIVLLSILSSIALSGLLMIIAAVAIRGLQRKLAGPTQLDHEPMDLLPMTPQRPDADAAPPAGTPTSADSAAQETRLT